MRDQTRPETDYDVIVIGGSFSGSSFAWLLKSRHPQARILIVEKSTDFDRKVGESTSEVAGCFLTRVLKVGEHLARKHVAKHGLHLWYNGEGNTDPARCTELGPQFQVRMPTYQLQRNVLDQHLLERALGLGCELLRPATVRKLELADDKPVGTDGKPTETNQGKMNSEGDMPPKNDDDIPHCITLRSADGETRTLSARWIVDASGRASLIARKRGTLQPLSDHPINSMWARFKNVRDFESWEQERDQTGLSSRCLTPRFNTTNHFCGYGWWCWMIPLANGELSAGLTWDPRLFTPEKKDKVVDTLLHHLRKEPVGHALFEHAEAVENDTRTYSKLSFQSTQVSGRRWAAIGDAAGFMDPLYSQGLDYCAHSSFSVMKLIEADFNSDHACPVASAGYNEAFQLSYQRWFNAIYRDKYAYLGDSELMRIAYLLDVGIYFLGPVRFVYQDAETEFSQMPYSGGPGKRVSDIMAFYNRRLVKIALRRRAAGTYGKRNLDHTFLIKAGFGPNFLAVKQIFHGTRLWLKAELNALFLPRADRDEAFGSGPVNRESSEPTADATSTDPEPAMAAMKG